jgi:uncharacterized protein (TIGR03084 family)
MVELADVLADLAAESADVDRLVAQLPADKWRLPTPAVGWTITHQIAHLTWTDEAATLAIRDPDAFAAHIAAAIEDPTSFVDRGAEELLDEPPVVLRRWREGRTALADNLAAVPAGTKVPWYATAMSPASLATARIMETWAHGLDIAETLGANRPLTARLRHIAHLGHRTFGFSFLANGRPVPHGAVRLDLTAPDGTQWTFGPADAANRVSGPALDFCLLVAQRRHRDDLDLTATGEAADEWLDIAQVFAGPSGGGRAPTGITASSGETP